MLNGNCGTKALKLHPGRRRSSQDTILRPPPKECFLHAQRGACFLASMYLVVGHEVQDPETEALDRLRHVVFELL